MLFSVRDIDVCNIFYFSKMNWIDNSYFFVNEKTIFKAKVKVNNKNVTFPNQFCMGSICNNSATLKQKKYL